MRLRRRHREHAEVAVESLNDIMFMLMLFFLIVSTLANPSVIKLLLPESKQSQSIDKQPIQLTVTAEHQYYIDKDLVAADDLKGCSSAG
jgi:biopolymer transport protein ExbD